MSDDEHLDLRTLASLHGRSMTQELRDIIRQASEAWSADPARGRQWTEMREALKRTRSAI